MDTGSQLLGRAPASRVGVAIQYVVRTIAVLALAGSVWESIGPFAAITPYGSLACGSPFLGRYTAGQNDVAATLASACFVQSGDRRLATFLLAFLSIAAALVARSIVRHLDRDGTAAGVRSSVARLPRIIDRGTLFAGAGIALVGLLAIVVG